LDELRKSYDSKDVESIKKSIENMNAIWAEVSVEMYQSTQQNESSPVEEVDFEEVKS
jgi:hypothetical protein